MVTAKHVADKGAGDFWVRYNRADGGSVKVQVDREWINHPSDNTADIAVLQWTSMKDMDHLLIAPESMLTSREMVESAGIGVGDEVFLAGMFASAHGGTRITPIVRKGNLAMLPEDKILTHNLGAIDAYLIEAHSFGGISGSPVFVRETLELQVTRKPKKAGERPTPMVARVAGDFYLIGLAHGHWEIDDKDLNAVYMRPPTREELGVNLGISIVVPASKILETLDHPNLLLARQKGEQQILSQQAPIVPDNGVDITLEE